VFLASLHSVCELLASIYDSSVSPRVEPDLSCLDSLCAFTLFEYSNCTAILADLSLVCCPSAIGVALWLIRHVRLGAVGTLGKFGTYSSTQLQRFVRALY
jgi:hypothetical protein